MIKPALVKILAAAGILLCAGCSTARKGDGYAYKVKMHGSADWSMSREIKESTATWKLRKLPPSTPGQLQYRMDNDLETIEAIMESRGFYDGTVSTKLNKEDTPARAAFLLETGEVYRFRRIDLYFLGDTDTRLAAVRPRIRQNQPVTAAAVFEEQRRILELLSNDGYPFPKLVSRVVKVDRELRTVDVALVFDPGELAVFSETLIEGLDELPAKYVLRQVPWKAGERYDAGEVDEFQRTLLKSGLFKYVRVEPQKPAGQTNAYPVTVRVGERDKRTIRLGLSYSDIGPGAKVYWEHRSLFGGGERLESSLSWSPIELRASGTLTRSGFLGARQSLVLDADASVETPDAYDAKALTASALVLRDFTTRIRGGLGIGYKYSLVEQFASQDRYNYVFFPLQAMYDSSDDRLNPVRGEQLFGRTSYFEDTVGAESFLKTEAEGRHYLMLWERYRLSSALRLTLGSIDGAAVENIPADERFYAGGGGSIRGYEYQSVGPVVAGVPTGGDKLFEFSTELRLQPGKQLGYVVFLDGGTTFNDRLDSFDRSLRYGAGVGLRWFTTIGPLRVDLAYPLNPSDNQVERLQFYISLGQAF